jgi:hypothetical protein
LFAAGTGEAATPALFVLTVTEFAPPNVALAPLVGAANVTGTSATGMAEASVTFA